MLGLLKPLHLVFGELSGKECVWVGAQAAPCGRGSPLSSHRCQVPSTAVSPCLSLSSRGHFSFGEQLGCFQLKGRNCRAQGLPQKSPVPSQPLHCPSYSSVDVIHHLCVSKVLPLPLPHPKGKDRSFFPNVFNLKV